MITNKPIAAIDIGSNAIRLVLGVSDGQEHIRLVKKYRVPIRLGHDVFVGGKITAKTAKEALRAFKKFSDILKKNGTKQVKAVATSALREAKNRKEFIRYILENANIPIQIIDGVEEAHLIHLAVKHEVPLENKLAMLIDIGGGSVEVTFSEDGNLISSQSFKLGTVRLLEQLNKKRLKEENLQLLINQNMSTVSHFIRANSKHRHVDFAVGTGGNIESLGRLKALLLRKTPCNYLSSQELGEIINSLQSLTYSERVKKLHLRPDRADVIIPAALVVQSILRTADVHKLSIPYVGLKDGILRSIN